MLTPPAVSPASLVALDGPVSSATATCRPRRRGPHCINKVPVADVFVPAALRVFGF